MESQAAVGPTEAVDELLAMSRASLGERVSAASAMARFATRLDVFARLKEMLDDADEAVVMAAAKALLVSEAQAAPAAVLGKLESPGPDTGLADAVAGVIWVEARDPYVFDRVARVVDDEQVPREVRVAAASMVEELTRMGLPLSADVRAYLDQKARDRSR